MTKAMTVSKASGSLDEIAAHIRELRQRTADDLVAIGRLLLRAKSDLEHGEWGDWLDREFAWSQDTASRLIAVAKMVDEGKFRTLRNLDAISLYELAKPSTLQEARDHVAKLVEDGGSPTPSDVRQIIRVKSKPAKQEPETFVMVRGAGDGLGIPALLKRDIDTQEVPDDVGERWQDTECAFREAQFEAKRTMGLDRAKLLDAARNLATSVGALIEVLERRH